MFGLVVGLIRMVLDFTFREPLCMEVDERPFIVKQVLAQALLSWCSRYGDEKIKRGFTKYVLTSNIILRTFVVFSLSKVVRFGIFWHPRHL
jgi:hypothetical protein